MCIRDSINAEYMGIGGGAIFWDYLPPLTIDAQFINNTAKGYGRDIASYVVGLILLRSFKKRRDMNSIFSIGFLSDLFNSSLMMVISKRVGWRRMIILYSINDLVIVQSL
eukprot:TRINITY_DN10670_c0_g1_i2.p1 TRINITY_DN10670_c0_g1~~TRINITY_DN10670_c0_g1_i2.p1  ORF type:complete len:129 (-),score=36.07 TRINITY_DN10670_c0_g1_i2:241-570(-)